MTDRPDPIDLLAAARLDERYLDPSANADADRLLQRILDSDAAGALRSRRRRNGVIALSVATVGIGAGTVAAAVVWRDSPTELATLGCWSDATTPLPAEIAVVRWDGGDPVAMCTPIWENDGFESMSTSAAPALVACVSRPGAVAVVPGDTSTCAELGLPLYDDTPDPDAERTRAAMFDIEKAVNETTCLDADAAVAVVEGILDDAGLDDWTISPPAPLDDTQCATAGIVVNTRTITIVPGV